MKEEGRTVFKRQEEEGKGERLRGGRSKEALSMMDTDVKEIDRGAERYVTSSNLCFLRVRSCLVLLYLYLITLVGVPHLIFPSKSFFLHEHGNLSSTVTTW